MLISVQYIKYALIWKHFSFVLKLRDYIDNICFSTVNVTTARNGNDDPCKNLSSVVFNLIFTVIWILIQNRRPDLKQFLNGTTNTWEDPSLLLKVSSVLLVLPLLPEDSFLLLDDPPLDPLLQRSISKVERGWSWITCCISRCHFTFSCLIVELIVVTIF